MDFSLNLSLSDSPLIFIALDGELRTRSASSSWNKFCNGLPSIDLWQIIDQNKTTEFRTWLNSSQIKCYDLWINHPQSGRFCFRCQKVSTTQKQIVLQLVEVSEFAIDKKLLQLLSGLTDIAELFYETPKSVQHKCLDLVIKSLHATDGSFGFFDEKKSISWLAQTAEPVPCPTSDFLTRSSVYHHNGYVFIPLRHRSKTIGVLTLHGVKQVLMSENGWQLIGQFFTPMCLQAMNESNSQLLQEKLKRTQTFLEQTNTIGMIGGWEVNVETNEVYWTEETHRIHGTDPNSYTPNAHQGLQFYVTEHREDIAASFTQLMQTGLGFDKNYQIQKVSHEIVWVRVVGKAEISKGKIIRVFGIFQDIDQLHRASLQVYEAKKTLELVQEASSDGFWDWDLKENMVRYNPRWKTMLGYGVDELQDGYETWKNLIHPEDFPNTQNILDEHWSKRTPYSHTSRFKHKNGSWRTILVRATTVRNELDQPVRMLGVHTDVTVLTELRREAKDQAFKTSLVMNALGIGLWDWDVEKDRLDWDEQLFKLYEVDKKNFKNTFEDWRKTVDPIYLPEAEERVSKTILNGVIFDHVFKLKPEHSSKMIKGHGVILRDSKGKPRRLMGINYDVTREKEIEQDLNVFKQLAEMSPDIVGLINKDGDVTFLNESAKRLGWHCGVGAKEYFPHESLELFHNTILPALKNRGQWEGEVIFRDLKRTENFSVNQRAFLMRDLSGKVQAIATVGVDLREKKKLEKELELQRLQFMNNSKMTALGEMASGMAHEINNPLAIIKGNITVLRMQLNDQMIQQDTLVSFLDKQDNTVDRIASIIAGLRNFSRDHSQTDFSSFSVQDMLYNTLTFCEARFKNNGIVFKLESPAPKLSVRGRETQLSQAILNLLNNSFDAVVGTKDATIKLSVIRDGVRLKILISNSGSHISPKLRDRIMEPFFTTKEVGKGTGLGLPIAKGIIETHGGRLYLDVEAPETCFVVELPLET